MSKVTEEALAKAYKPFDIVSIGKNVGFISEVNINESQTPAMINYSITWLVDDGAYNSWHPHDNLVKHCNLFVKIAENMCDPFSNNMPFVSRLLLPKI